MSTRSHVIVGALLLTVGALAFWSAEAVAAGAWSNPAFSFHNDVISDLRDPVSNDYLYGHVVNSPLSFGMNCGFVVDVILYGVADFLLHSLFSERRRIAVLMSGVLVAVGLVVISVLHEQSVNAAEMAMHWIGAFLILGDAIAVGLVGVFAGRANASMWYRILSIGIGIVIFVSFMSLVTVPSLAVDLGAGTMERTAMWGAPVWQVVTEIVLLVGASHLGTLTKEGDSR